MACGSEARAEPPQHLPARQILAPHRRPALRQEAAGLVRHEGVPYYLGVFDTEEQAARARDKKAKELSGPYARLNFPEDPPQDGGHEGWKP